MEDYKKKLLFNNIGIQLQTLRKLQDLIIKQKKTDGPLGADSPQPPELGLLFEKCADSQTALAVGSCDALVDLVRASHVDFGMVMAGLLNSIPTAKNLTGIGGALTDLLVIQLLSESECETDTGISIYGIRTQPHPFVTMVTNRSDSWPILLRQVQRLMSWRHPRVQEKAVHLVLPFFRFVLLEPAMSSQFLQLRLTLPRTALQTAKDVVCRRDVLRLLEEIARCLQIRSANHLAEAVTFLDLLGTALLQTGPGQAEDFYKEVRGHVACHCLALNAEALRIGVDGEGLVCLATKLLKKGVKEDSLGRIWLLTVQLLLRQPESHLSSLLGIVHLCLAKEEASLPRPLLASAMLPLLHIASLPSSGSDVRKPHQTLATRLVQRIEASLKSKDAQQDSSDMCVEVNPASYITAEVAVVDAFVYLAQRWSSDHSSCSDWLEKVQMACRASPKVPEYVTLIVTGLCVLNEQKKLLLLALDILAHVARVNPEQAPYFLVLFMFCLSYHEKPTMKMIFLEAIPNVATHTVTIAPTLNVLQLLANTPSLKPVALRLVTSLWKLQDRCFPYLQRMLQSPDYGAVSMDTGFNEFLVAKAACIRDICEERPHQHGADMLAPLSAILNNCGTDADVIPACLALEGLVALCEAEVVDIRTVWAVLAPKLNQDKRAPITRRICQLFSLVPTLSTDSEDYQAFRLQTLGSLWKLAQSSDDEIASAAYRALAAFSKEEHTLSLLPEKVTEDHGQAAAEADPTEELPEIPGVCFVRVVECARDGVLAACSEFLTAVIKEEVTNLPRGVYHLALSRRVTRPTRDKVLSTVPELLTTRFERNKQPMLRAALATGLLFCFDPPAELGRDGRPRRQAIVARGRAFHQMLYSLLHDVTMQPSDWHRCMVIPRAWASFMDRCYHAYLDCRQAELSLALDQGQVNDPEEHELLMNTAWMWTRDKLMDLIKSASRGEPAVQANCMLAVAGLTVSASRYASGLDEAAQAAARQVSEHLGHAHWLSVMSNTFFAMLNPGATPPGRVFAICQQHPGQALSSVSALARGAACLAFPLVVPVLSTVNMEMIAQTLESAVGQLPGRVVSGSRSAALLFYRGLGLGMLLARLFEGHLADVAGPQAQTAIWKALRALEEAGFSDEDNRQGCLLGLALCIPPLCADGKIDSRQHVGSLQEQLMTTASSMDHKDLVYPAVVLCLAVLGSACYTSGLMSTAEVNSLMGTVHDAHCEDTTDSGLAVAVGGLCHGLASAGHPTICQLSGRLEAAWTASLKQQELSTLQKLSVLHGVLSLAGADFSLFMYGSEKAAEGRSPPASALVQAAIDAVKSPGDSTLNSSAAWRLGQLCLEATASSSTDTAVPSSYQYLPETSVLRAVVDRLIQAGKSGDLSCAQMSVLLRGLVEGPSRPLPPLNWATVLSPILRLSHGEPVMELCLDLTIRQAPSASSASLLLASWMIPPLWNGLQESCQLIILDNLPSIIKSVPAPKLRDFFNGGFLELFKGGEAGVVQERATRGLCAALRVHDPPQSVTLTLHLAFENLYKVIPNEPQLYGPLADCMREIPDALVDTVTKEDFSDGTAFSKAAFIRCRLIADGHQPLSWLNPAIDLALWEDDSLLLYNSEPKAELLTLIVNCFHQCKSNKTEANSAGKLSQWLLELMGHVRSVANGLTPPPEGMTLKPGAVEFGLLVFAAAVVMSADVNADLVLGITSDKNDHSTRQANDLKQLLKALLPLGLSNLLQAEQWKRMTGKILDWLITMHGTSMMSQLPEWQAIIKGSIRSLRHTTDFRKMAIWSRAYML